MSRRLLAPAALLGALALFGACTLTHPLDGYGDGVAASDSGSPESSPSDPRDSSVDTGDGCSGDPQIVAPTSGAVVGATVRLVVSGPSCLQRMILYVDDTENQHFVGNSIDQDIPIALGTHHINVNAWAGGAHAHQSGRVTITRTK